jgi:hypothetical protein
MKFLLIGRSGPVFVSVLRFSYFDIDCVRGVTEDGRLQTVARVVDVQVIEE